MAFNISGKYVTVWESEDKGNYHKLKLGTSKKNQDGTYENSSWFANLVGKAHKKAQADGISEKSKIEVVSGLISNVYKKETGKSFVNLVIFEYELMGGASTGGFDVDDSIDEDDIPF